MGNANLNHILCFSIQNQIIGKIKRKSGVAIWMASEQTSVHCYLGIHIYSAEVYDNSRILQFFRKDQCLSVYRFPAGKKSAFCFIFRTVGFLYRPVMRQRDSFGGGVLLIRSRKRPVIGNPGTAAFHHKNIRRFFCFHNGWKHPCQHHCRSYYFQESLHNQYCIRWSPDAFLQNKKDKEQFGSLPFDWSVIPLSRIRS